MCYYDHAVAMTLKLDIWSNDTGLMKLPHAPGNSPAKTRHSKPNIAVVTAVIAVVMGCGAVAAIASVWPV